MNLKKTISPSDLVFDFSSGEAALCWLNLKNKALFLFIG